MTITLDLSPELEARINWNAQQQGVSPTDLVRRLVENAPLPEAMPSVAPSKADVDAEGPTLWELHHEALQAMWDAQPDGPTTYYSEMEEACDVPQDNAPILFERIQATFQPFWDAEKKGPRTNYADLEEACDTPEANKN